MADPVSTTYFLGANAPSGFYSLFSAYQQPHIRQLHILKGTPGSGKSTLMKHIAQEAEDAGHSVERILCAADPDSLDAVYLPDSGEAWVDGTAPTSWNRSCPVCGTYIWT